MPATIRVPAVSHKQQSSAAQTHDNMVQHPSSMTSDASPTPFTKSPTTSQSHIYRSSEQHKVDGSCSAIACPCPRRPLHSRSCENLALLASSTATTSSSMKDFSLEEPELSFDMAFPVSPATSPPPPSSGLDAECEFREIISRPSISTSGSAIFQSATATKDVPRSSLRTVRSTSCLVQPRSSFRSDDQIAFEMPLIVEDDYLVGSPITRSGNPMPANSPFASSCQLKPQILTHRVPLLRGHPRNKFPPTLSYSETSPFGLFSPTTSSHSASPDDCDHLEDHVRSKRQQKENEFEEWVSRSVSHVAHVPSLRL